MDVLVNHGIHFAFSKAKENSKIYKDSIIEKFYLMCVLFMIMGLFITYFVRKQ